MPNTSLSFLEQLQTEANDQAWNQLDRLYTPLIHGWLSRQNVLGADREDLAQDVLLVVLRKLPQFEHNHRPGAFRNWLRRITLNCLRDFWRTKKIRPISDGDTSFEMALDQLADESSDICRKWNEDHDRIVTRQLLDQIQPQFEPATWSAFEQVAIREKPAQQVATELGVSIGTVYKAKSRVLARLREAASGLID